MNTVVQILDSISEEAARADRSDGQLLDLFVRLRDEDAFAAVVRRHGPMVLGVCRRILRNAADADDAFQAAFLVLARKAGSIGTRDLLAQWLYGVASNTARKLRQSNTRRAAREAPLEEANAPQATPNDVRDELLAILDEELARLPERYRAVIVLCDLEGLTRREAAQKLACPEGTVAGRLARARTMLASRLTARGVVPAAGLLAAVLTESAAQAVSPAIVAGVVRTISVSGLASAAAKGLISQRVAETTEGVLKTMFATKLRAVAAITACCGLALACTVGAMHFANAQPTPDSLPFPLTDVKAAPEKPEPDAEKKLTVFPLKKLDPEATAKVVADAYKGKGVLVTPLTKDSALMVYASEKATTEIESLLQKLGEQPPKKASLFRIPTVDADEAARTILKLVPRDEVTVIPVPSENVLLVYATEARLGEIRDMLRTGERTPKPAEPKKYTFRFKAVPWSDVLDWYAKETGLVMITTVKPVGSFTCVTRAGKQFTLEEVTDLLNEALAQQKFILIRRKMTFFIQPTDEKIDSKDIPRIELSELPQRGKTEIVQVVLPVHGMVVADVQDELKKLLTPFGSIVPLGTKNFVLIQDTVGNIIRIRELLEKIEGTTSPDDSLEYVCEWRPAQQVAEVIKTLLTDKDTAVTITGTKGDNEKGKNVLIAVDVRRNAIIVTAPQDKLALAKKIIKETDKPQNPTDPPHKATEPVLKTYNVPPGSAAEVAKSLTAVIARLQVVALDKQNQILVLATPEDHLRVEKLLQPKGKDEKPAGRTYTIKFQKTAWKDVLTWYSFESGLTRVGDALPTGTFTFDAKNSDQKQYTLDEVTDIINEALLAQKWLLVRGKTTFAVVPADEKIDPKWILRVKLEELDTRGLTELVEIELRPGGPAPSELVGVVKKLSGPFGEAIAFDYGNLLIIRDTVGNLRRIVKTVRDTDTKPKDK